MTSVLAKPAPGPEPAPKTVNDPGQIVGALTSSQFDVVDYAGRYASLARALKLDFSHIMRTLRYIPACVEAAHHGPLRRQIGELIAERQTLARNLTPLILDQLLARLHHPGAHELVTTVLRPYIEKTLRILSGIELDETTLDQALLSALFSQGAGIARRRRLNAQLGTVWQWLDQVYAAEPESRRGVRLALIVLGSDATLGTLADSLHAALPRRRAPFSELEFAAAPTHTGVPYVDRRAVTSGTTGGQVWAADAVARLQLNIFEANALADERHRFFGAGAHTCLGRAIATKMWVTLGQALRDLPGEVEVESLTWARSDVLRIPQEFWVKISHD